jgi:tetratricopeptide (TPR) repeat protein
LVTSDQELRNYDLAIELAQRGCQLTDWSDPDLCRLLAMAYAGSAGQQHYQENYAQAIAHLRRAIEVDPQYDVALLNLAVLLATCDDPQFRRPQEAIELAERGCGLAGHIDPARLRILAMAYAAAGQRDRAIAATDKAIELAQAAGETAMTAELRSLRGTYEDVENDRD